MSQPNKVDDHRNMVMVSKCISEFQENNLKTWGHIVFNDVETVKIDYDFVDGKREEFYAGKVSFDFTFREGKEPDEDRKKHAFKNLTNWCQVLFWADTEVSFKKKGKKWT